MPLNLKRLYEPISMIHPDKIVGEIPKTGDMYAQTFQIAWPSMTESLLVALVSIVDTIMVSSLGAYAIAAVGITNQPRFIVLAMFFALNMGITAVVSRRKGQNDRDGANRCLRQCLFIAFFLSIILTVLAFAYARPLLLFAGAQSDTIDPAIAYFRIVMIGIPPTVLTLAINAAQRGVGNTRLSMWTNVTANVVNCIFNWFLITGNWGFPALGVAGAAIATTLGNCVAMCMAIRSIMHKNGFLHLTIKQSYIPDRETMASIIKISSSAALEQVFVRIGFFIYVKIVANLGTNDYATHQICMNILSISFSFGDGLTVAASALVGQNLGRKRPDLAYLYCKCTQRIGFIISAVLMIIYLTCSRQIMHLFSPDPYIIDTGAKIIMFISLITTGQITQVIYSGCLRGAGDTFFVAACSMVSIALVRPVVSWVLCYPAGLGLFGAWYGVIIDQYLRLLINGWRFKGGKWATIEV